MRVVGLTGSIACGKSTVSLTLKELGAVIIDGDAISRALTAEGGEALPAIREAFGDAVFREDGSLDRRALGRAVFGCPEALERLDSLMQPLILRRIEAELAEARARGAGGCVLDMPLLFEKGLDRLCDSVWCVWLPGEEQLSRLMLRDGLPREDAEKRIASQLSSDEKAARAQVIIDTRGSIPETAALIPPLWQRELAADR